MFIMSANLSGIVGSQLFQASDKPKYITGWNAIVAIVAVATFLSCYLVVQYRLLNKRNVRSSDEKRYKY